jgi:hypothetical protein
MTLEEYTLHRQAAALKAAAATMLEIMRLGGASGYEAEGWLRIFSPESLPVSTEEGAEDE